MITALEEEDSDTLYSAFEHGVDVNQPIGDKPLLHHIAGRFSAPLWETLLGFDFDIDVKDKSGSNPMV